MLILGINAYHGDSSACILKDGKIIAAAEEERFRRVKHWAGFPSNSIIFCLNEAGISLNELNHLAINHNQKANYFRKILFLITNPPEFNLIKERLINRRKRKTLLEEINSINNDNFSGQIHEIEHHYAHLSSSFHVSPFEKATIVSVDGFGDFASTAWGTGDISNINLEGKVYFPHSLGIFYQSLTQWLGFPNYGDEYKVMGLAPYGKPNLMKEMRDILHLFEDGTFKLNLKYFKHHSKRVPYEWNNCEPKVGRLFTSQLEQLLGLARKKDEELTQYHFDVASSVQAMYEEAFFNLLNKLHKKHSTDNICLAGGCANNSVANGKIYNKTSYKKVYVQSAAGDAGGAIGSALSTWHNLKGIRNFEMKHAYWGPEFSETYLTNIIKKNEKKLYEKNCNIDFISDEDKLCLKVAKSISEGKVIGWFQGKMEWGPRALGNRSILGDPRRSDMKEILNLKIKRRESFRPFAPSVLKKHVDQWFEETDEVPFMMQVFKIKENRRKSIPAVTHVDGTGRLQTVESATNPKYHNLINKFYKISGVPMILNTSFNENEPVVCNPEEAMDCFLRTKMDILVLGDWLIQRKNNVDVSS